MLTGGVAVEKLEQSFEILPSKNRRKDDAMSVNDAQFGRHGRDLRERRVLRVDHS